MNEIKSILNSITKNNEDLYENNEKIVNKIERFQNEFNETKNMKLQVNSSIFIEKIQVFSFKNFFVFFPLKNSIFFI